MADNFNKAMKKYAKAKVAAAKEAGSAMRGNYKKSFKQHDKAVKLVQKGDKQMDKHYAKNGSMSGLSGKEMRKRGMSDGAFATKELSTYKKGGKLSRKKC